MDKYIFVYGTLKTGGWNHDLLQDCRFVGRASPKGFILIDMGGCPGMVPGKPGYHAHYDDAIGELYAVAEEIYPRTIERLDALENNGITYVRVQIEVEIIKSGTIKECTTYLYMPTYPKEIIVKLGEWDQMAANRYYTRHGP